jgi:Protein of unknown function (DUF4238)
VSEPTRHHYIPIFYLRQWAGPDGKLCEYSRPYAETKAKRKHPSGTGYVAGLYTIPGISPEQSQFVEKRFMQAVDNWAARALAVMLRGNPQPHDLDRRLKVAWARFLYSLIIRTPEHIRRIQQKADENPPELPETLREDYDKLRGPNDPATFEEYKAWSSANPLKLPAQQILPELINSERVITEIAFMRWTTAPLGNTKHSMLTSDRPVIMTNGLVQADAHIAIPLSPKLLFLATKTDETHRAISSMSSNEIVEVVNHKVSEQAVKYVYGIDDRQIRFVANRLGRMVPSTPLG